MRGQFRRRHSQRLEPAETYGEVRIFGNVLGVKLLVNPLLEPGLAYTLAISGSRSEGQAIESLQNL